MNIKIAKKKNIKHKIYCFDIDGVICNTKKNYYHSSRPIVGVIRKINEIHSNGNTVIIFTARYMGRSKENVLLAKKKGYNFTYRQLKKWDVKFDKLIFGKPSFDYIIDDKSIFFKKNWYKYLK